VKIVQWDSCEFLVAIKSGREVVFVPVGVVAMDFHDFGDKAPPRTAFKVHDNIYAIADVGFDRANANVRPETTIATRDSPRAIVLVNACCNTLTAFSHGELACAKTGAARRRPRNVKSTTRAD
jgi:hypothetical protein